MRDVRLAVVGAGPAGIYAADIVTQEHPGAHVDLIERLPAPFGPVRYGVAPDHPRIKEIVKALQRVVRRDRIRFIGNVSYGVDLKLDDLRRYYDAVVFATGAMADRSLDIPGIDLPGSYGAADFVSWYAGHPEIPFDHQGGVITNDRGRVLDLDGVPLPGLYVTGWVKRGPIGLIGHTKSDAAETIASLLADIDTLPQPEIRDPQGILEHLAGRGATVIDSDGWARLDAHEIALGEAAGRERIKVVPRDDMLNIANA